MGVFLESVSFQDEFNGTYSGGGDIGTPNLMGCVGDFMYATIKCYVEWKIEGFNAIFSNASNTITLNNTIANINNGGYISPPQFSKGNPLLSAFLGNSFINSGFKVGDTFTVVGSTNNDGNYTIKALTDTVITTVEVIAHTATNTGVNIYGTTPVNYMDFYYNVIGGKQGANFKSTTDKNALQKYSGKVSTGYESNFTLAGNTTSQAWKTLTVNGVTCVPTVTNEGVLGFKQRFTIVFPFLVTPMFQSEQLQLLKNVQEQASTLGLNDVDFVKPKYFIDDCLNFIYQIDFKYALTNSVPDQSSYNLIDFGAGNTSWFNSFFPSGVDKSGTLLTNTGFWVKSVVYTDNSGNVLDSIDINNPTNVLVVIAHQSTNPGSAMPLVLNFMGLPVNTGVLQGYQFINQANYREVFLHDRCKTYTGNASANGDMFGGVTQALKNVVVSTLNSTLKQISFTVDLGTLSKSTLAELTPNDANYMLFITPQSASQTTLATADRSAVIIDVNKGFINNDDSSLLVINTNGANDIHFFDYGIGNLVLGAKTDVKDFIGSYYVAKCQFKIKRGCVLNSLIAGFEVDIYQPDDYYYTSEIVNSFMIESWTKSTAQFFNKTKNEILINESRGYPLPANDKRNLRVIFANPTLDDEEYFGYQLNYGFQLDYHWWVANNNVTLEFEQFPANYWALYTQGYTSVNTGKRAIADGFGSNIKFKIGWQILNPSTGIVTEFIRYSNVSCYDDGNNENGSSVDLDTTDLYGSSLFSAIPIDMPFKIQAIFENPNEFDPLTAVIEIILYYNNGATEFFDRITSNDVSPETPNSFFTGPIVWSINQTNDRVIALATLDLSKSIFPLQNCNIFAKIKY